MAEIEIRLEIDKTALARGAVRHAVRAAIGKACLDIQAEAQRSIQSGPKTGRVYKRGGSSHQASAPGQAPATDTSALVNSISADLSELDQLEGIVAVGAEYAVNLELGTAHMLPRPFMGPAVEKVKPELEKAIRHIVDNPPEV